MLQFAVYYSRMWSVSFVVLLMVFGLPPVDSQAADKQPQPPAPLSKQQSNTTIQPIDATKTAAIEKRWGVIIQGIKFAAAGHMLDFRFRITDPGKSATLMDPKNKPFATIEGKDIKLEVPNVPRIGALRQKTQQAKKGMTLAILFANPGKMVTTGQKLTITIGDFSIEHIPVGKLLNAPPKLKKPVKK